MQGDRAGVSRAPSTREPARGAFFSGHVLNFFSPSGYYPGMRDADDKLSPADPRDIVTALALGLTSGRQLARSQAAEIMAKIVAERLVEHLSASGFVIMRKPLAGGPRRPALRRGQGLARVGVSLKHAANH
jgi:hypothetical protein